MLAAVSSPQASLTYLQRALQINPHSERAQKGLVWAQKRLAQSPSPPALPAQNTAHAPPERTVAAAQAASVGERTQPTRPVPSPIEAQPAPNPATRSAGKPSGRASRPPKRRDWPVLPLLAFLLCLALAWVIWWSVTPVAAFLRSAPGHAAWAPAEISKATRTASPLPSATPSATETASPTFTSTPSPSPSPSLSPTPTVSLTPTPSATASVTPTEEITPTPLPTDTAVPTRVIPTLAAPQLYSPETSDERWIDVDLSRQMLYAYEGNTLVNAFVVSTGTWRYPTVTGQYRIYIKYRYKDMSGPGYYLKNVPYTMFFYQGYAIHGTYWHNNFGTPMSHGCVNLRIADAEWLYNFASVGTLVNVHY
ncbi:MAG: hypothetical protein DDG60_04485 [Anaerolineae bacterium]|nr:MAG: hypothetical protein DDG60_04485 [Anaerolineae bacterium]